MTRRAWIWAGLAMASACAALWAVSLFYVIVPIAYRSTGLVFSAGHVYGGYWPGANHLALGITRGRTHVRWGTELFTSRGTNDCVVYVPLWMPFLATACPSLIAAYFGRRRPRAGLCIHCQYDLASTPSGSVCPECGAARGPGAG